MIKKNGHVKTFYNHYFEIYIKKKLLIDNMKSSAPLSIKLYLFLFNNILQLISNSCLYVSVTHLFYKNTTQEK